MVSPKFHEKHVNAFFGPCGKAWQLKRNQNSGAQTNERPCFKMKCGLRFEMRKPSVARNKASLDVIEKGRRNRTSLVSELALDEIAVYNQPVADPALIA